MFAASLTLFQVLSHRLTARRKGMEHGIQCPDECLICHLPLPPGGGGRRTGSYSHLCGSQSAGDKLTELWRAAVGSGGQWWAAVGQPGQWSASGSSRAGECVVVGGGSASQNGDLYPALVVHPPLTPLPPRCPPLPALPTTTTTPTAPVPVTPPDLAEPHRRNSEGIMLIPKR